MFVFADTICVVAFHSAEHLWPLCICYKYLIIEVVSGCLLLYYFGTSPHKFKKKNQLEWATMNSYMYGRQEQKTFYPPVGPQGPRSFWRPSWLVRNLCPRCASRRYLVPLGRRCYSDSRRTPAPPRRRFHSKRRSLASVSCCPTIEMIF